MAEVDKKKQARKIVRQLAKDYPDAECALRHNNPFQLLVATILSAQCTDARVNEVTQNLFKNYKSPRAFAKADIEELEEDIRPTGFFRNKARNIQDCSRAIVEEHNGKVPRTMEDLTELAGVGRKTANVILGTAFGVPGIVVDTHVARLSKRLGLTKEKDPAKIEQDLLKVIGEKDQVDFCHRMIHHGRRICVARKPKCPECALESICPKVGVDR